MSTQYATQPREELLTVPQSGRPMRFPWAERADVRSGSRRFHRPLPFFVNADLIALLKDDRVRNTLRDAEPDEGQQQKQQKTNTTMTKNFKLTRKSWYMILTIILPVALFGLWVGLAIFCRDHHENPWIIAIGNFVWSQFNKIWLWFLVPVLTNIAFGPSLLAFTINRKKNRFLILILNVIAVGLTAVIFEDWTIGFQNWWPDWSQWLPFVAIPPLFLWVKWGKAAEATENSRPGVKMLLAHVCAFAALFATVHYKSPGRQVAEEMLRHRTLKWEHDGKTEYFSLFDQPRNSVDWGSGAYYVGPALIDDVYDHNWKINSKRDEYFDIAFTNKGLDIMFFGYSKIDRREFITYEQLFNSKEIELIDGRKVFNVALRAKYEPEEAKSK
jgi:hypothetical protein